MSGVLYENALSSPDDLEGWVGEGPVSWSAGEDGLVLESSADEERAGDLAHWTLWCPVPFDDGIRVEWDFRPIVEPGLAMLFFAARGHSGDLFGPAQRRRDGYYPQYHSGDIDALHISYLRHKHESERAFRTCNLRKSAGFHLVAQGADPLPPAEDARGFYRMRLESAGGLVRFGVRDLTLLEWTDDGAHGPVLGGGHIGFRQMAPLRAEYRDFRVTAVPASDPEAGGHPWTTRGQETE